MVLKWTPGETAFLAQISNNLRERYWTVCPDTLKPKKKRWERSSIGRSFRSPLRSAEQDGGPSASGRYLGWPHFPRKWKCGHPRWRPEAEGPPSCSALRNEDWKFSLGLWWHHFHRCHLGWRHPRWRRRKWRLEDVGTLVKTPSRHLPRQSWVMPSSQKGPKYVL